MSKLTDASTEPGGARAARTTGSAWALGAALLGAAAPGGGPAVVEVVVHDRWVALVWSEADGADRSDRPWRTAVAVDGARVRVADGGTDDAPAALEPLAHRVAATHAAEERWAAREAALREEVAGILHDRVGGGLAGAGFLLDGIRSGAAADAGELVTLLRSAVTESLATLAAVVASLRPRPLAPERPAADGPMPGAPPLLALPSLRRAAWEGAVGHATAVLGVGAVEVTGEAVAPGVAVPTATATFVAADREPPAWPAWLADRLADSGSRAAWAREGDELRVRLTAAAVPGGAAAADRRSR